MWLCCVRTQAPNWPIFLQYFPYHFAIRRTTLTYHFAIRRTTLTYHFAIRRTTLGVPLYHYESEGELVWGCGLSWAEAVQGMPGGVPEGA